MDQQRKTIAELVGSQDLADHYVQDFDSDIYLARGHLSPNADFIFYSWMDSTYHFVNVAPQWQAFNGAPSSQLFFSNKLLLQGVTGCTLRLVSGTLPWRGPWTW